MTKYPKSWEREKILLIHTGGHLWLYDKVDQMSSLMGNWYRMDGCWRTKKRTHMWIKTVVLLRFTYINLIVSVSSSTQNNNNILMGPMKLCLRTQQYVCRKLTISLIVHNVIIVLFESSVFVIIHFLLYLSLCQNWCIVRIWKHQLPKQWNKFQIACHQVAF